MKSKDHSLKDTPHQKHEPVLQRCECEENDDFFIDESLVRLLQILLPRMKWIILLSCLVAFGVGAKIYTAPREYTCSATIAPDLVRDMNSFDLIEMKTVDDEMIKLPIDTQITKLNTLAKSFQVRQSIIAKNETLSKWECETLSDCLKKLDGVYSVKEIRNVGLEFKAQHQDGDITKSIVESGIEATNQFFENAKKEKAQKSIEDIKKWIHDVTSEYELVSSEYISYASDHNITDFESQFASGISLVGSIKQNIVMKESELAELQQRYGDTAPDLLPIKGTIAELRKMLSDLLQGREPDKVYPALADYEIIKQKVRDYESRLQMLRSREELYNKALAAAQIEANKQSNLVMMLDEPHVEPASKGTVKFAVLAFIGVFFLLCIFLVMKEYWLTLREAMKKTK